MSERKPITAENFRALVRLALRASEDGSCRAINVLEVHDPEFMAMSLSQIGSAATHFENAARQLRDHLKAIGDRHRSFSITWAGVTITEVAETRSKARYRAFLRASDVDPDLTFAQFQSEAQVR